MNVWPINTKENKRSAMNAVKAIMGVDGLEVIIRKRVESGSKEQEAWFNILCRMLANETGDSPEAIKTHMKIEVFGLQVSHAFGKRIEFVPPSDFEGMPGFSKLIEKTYQTAAEMGFVLPPPRLK